MGRIKTKLIKRTALTLFKKHKDEIKPTFEENKQVVTDLLKSPNKKMRNIIAGYLARLAKTKEE
tara:strand:+ start:306 stop:497 length:192 start_codon:yes stop_codon:yes gene_type:complete